MSSVITGACVVCGKESSTRCSKCSTAGIDWMFFCSQDHQKLIWSSHKRVCGSSPFEWPSFNQDEVSELLHLIQEPLYTLSEADPYNSPRESRLEKDVRLREWANLAEAEADYAIRAEEASKASLNDSAVRQLVRLRLILFDLKNFELFWKIQGVIGSIILPNKFLRMVAQSPSPFDYLAYLVGNSVLPCYSDAINSPQYTLLYHRLVILITLGSLRHEEEIGSAKRGVKLSYFTESLESFIWLAESGDIYMYQGVLSDIFEKLVPKLMAEFGVANPSLSERLRSSSEATSIRSRW